MNRGRAVLSVYVVATGAALLLALPGPWRLLAALAVPALYAIWVLTPPPHRGAHELDQAQAEAEQEDWTATLGEPAPVTWLPDELADPIGYYSALADRYARPWQQRGPDDAPHPLTAPVPLASSETSGGPVPGGPPAAEPGTGDGGPPPIELDHDDQAGDDEDQAAELGWTWPGPYEQQADTLLERVRADFDLLRRMIL